MSSPLEQSEKVGSKSREIFLPIVSQETYFWKLGRGVSTPLSFAAGITATAVLGAVVAVYFVRPAWAKSNG